jgi:hypothetical protein
VAPEQWLKLISDQVWGLDMVPHIGRKLETEAIGGKILFKVQIIGATSGSFSELVGKRIAIQLDVDLTPPAGFVKVGHKCALLPGKEITIPTLDLPSLMAGKMHILLTRQDREKGRDWYDYIWYRNRDIAPNLVQLGNAIAQTSDLKVRLDCWGSYLRDRLPTVNWTTLRDDVRPFLENLSELTDLSELKVGKKTPWPPFEILKEEILAARPGEHALLRQDFLQVVRNDTKRAAKEDYNEAAIELQDTITASLKKTRIREQANDSCG